MINNRNEFMIYYWKYYRMIEDDFLELIKYIDIRKNNFFTSSDMVIKQLQTIGAEFDVICKEIEGVNLDEKKTISNHYEWIINNTLQEQQELSISQIQDLPIGIKNVKNMIIYPFMDWTEKKPGNLKWWKAYNEIKHSRTLNYEKGNFENLLNALGALYFMERLLLKKVTNNTTDMDIPDKDSQIFYIKGLKERYMTGDQLALEVVDEFEIE